MKERIELELVPGTAKVAKNPHGITGRIAPKVVGKWPGRALNHGSVIINRKGDGARATRRLKRIAKEVGVPLRQFVRDIMNGRLDAGDLNALWPAPMEDDAPHPMVAAAYAYAERNNIRGQA